MKFAYFLGCNAPTLAYNYELSVRKIASRFDVELIDIAEFGCCGEPVLSVDSFSSVVFAARNIAIANKQNLDILTLCNGCFSSLTKAAKLLEDNSFRAKVNGILNTLGLEYTGNSRIYHFLQLMDDLIGREEISKKITAKLDNVKVSCHNGCHILRPSHTLNFDDPTIPRKLEMLVSLTGAKIIPPVGDEQCCGSLLLPHDIDAAHLLAINSVEKKGKVDAIVVGCPFCFKQFDLGQVMAKRKFNKDLEIPVIFFSQLLGLALGFNEQELGFDILHKINTKKFLEKVKNKNG
jgi:heterodisulfide reductase subunit B